MNKSLSRIVVFGLYSVIIFSALAQGVVDPWSEIILELSIVALASIWALKMFLAKSFSVTIPSIAWPVGSLILFGAYQTLSRFDAAGNRRSISMDVEATRGTVLCLIGLLAILLLSANFLTKQERLINFAKFLTFFGLALATAALAQHFAAGEYSYWPWPIKNDSSFGPFVNRDHFAAYIELLIAAPLALIVSRQVKGEKSLPYAAAAVVMGIAAIFTLSRGGMLSLFAQLMFLTVFGIRWNARNSKSNSEHSLRTRRSHRSKQGGQAIETLAIGLILASITVGILWLGAEPILNRISTGDASHGDLDRVQSFQSVRGAIWHDAWRLIKEKPWTGAGLGAFETAYPNYAFDNGAGGVVAQAHNDYLQILADAGVVGGVIALWFLLLLGRGFVLGLNHPDPSSAAMALAGGTALFGLLIHSLFDFGLQLPSHALLFLSISAIVVQIGATVKAPRRERRRVSKSQTRKTGSITSPPSSVDIESPTTTPSFGREAMR